MGKPDIHKIDLLLQYVLTVASLEDWGNRELGPIHLIKYVYLADLAYAEHHGGETFTGVPWKFHHFGPWAVDSYHRIEPALQAIGAEKKTIESSKYEDDFIRWTIQDEQLYEELERKLDLVITSAVHQAIRTFGSDTYSLLDYVYKTWPMLHAAPGEFLDFTPPEFIETQYEQDTASVSVKPLSRREEKKQKEALKLIKQRLKDRLESKKRKRKFRPTPPRYDEVFFEGVKLLDSLAGKAIKPLEGSVTFSDDVWKSKARFDPDVS